MSDELARLLYEGALAVTEGRLDEGRELLMQVIERDESNELAWLWLSGAVKNSADQQIALENVLTLNPNNEYAKDGLGWLKQHVGARKAGTGTLRIGTGQLREWQPPAPWDENEVVEISCWQCRSSLYSVAPFCWQCHAPVHCCNNCAFLPEPRCKELQGLTSALVQAGKNECPWWHPKQ